jgi:hypothetical protein
MSYNAYISSREPFSAVCLNGHVHSYHTFDAPKFCTECAARIITKCPGCGEPLPARGTFVGENRKNVHCGECGKPFPWVTGVN